MTDGARLAVVLLLAAAACVGRPLPAAPDADGSVDGSIIDPAAFVSVPPCPTEADYATGTATVTFGFLGSPPGFVYEPSCLAIAAGTAVTFAGSFAAHPLYPSTERGTGTGNPIVGVSAGDQKVILFPDRGYFAYYCGIHGGADDGSTMAGVIWAR